jgi:toxin-antitoxin system PIN domain toxin
VKSLDANILVYAHNIACAEHPAALGVFSDFLGNASGWVLADQTLFEFYRCIRNPFILAKPASAADAAAIIDKVRNKSGCGHCHYSEGEWTQAIKQLQGRDFPYRRTFDAVLAATLLAHGVDTFYTHNLKDFGGSGFAKLIDPITGEEV